MGRWFPAVCCFEPGAEGAKITFLSFSPSVYLTPSPFEYEDGVLSRVEAEFTICGFKTKVTGEPKGRATVNRSENL